MNDLKEILTGLSERLEVIKKTSNLEEKQKELNGLEAKASDPNLWDDQENARKVMQDLSDLKEEIETFKQINEECATLLSLIKEDNSSALTGDVQKLNKAIEKFEIKSFLSGTYDKKNAVLSIHAGQGGTEAMDWVSMLYRMYLRYCERKSWKTETIDFTPGEEAGYKSVTFKVGGSYAYGLLKNEAGTHRLVRQSPFNADNLRQTSFALVEVLPELEEIDLPDFQIKEDELDWQFFRSSSQGGQNVQKVSTAVRLKHVPTGLTVTAQTERFQEQNRKIALDLLRTKLWAKKLEEEEKTKKDIKGEYRPASWGNQIRSYVLHPYKMVKDLRTDVETGNTEAVLDGEIDMFIDAKLKQL